MTDVPLPEPMWPANGRERPYVDAYSERQLRSYAEACVKAERERAQAEVLAWRERFPQYIYRPQDDCVALKMVAMDGK